MNAKHKKKDRLAAISPKSISNPDPNLAVRFHPGAAADPAS
jgi:hypothetical protein